MVGRARRHKEHSGVSDTLANREEGMFFIFLAFGILAFLLYWLLGFLFFWLLGFLLLLAFSAMFACM